MDHVTVKMSEGYTTTVTTKDQHKTHADLPIASGGLNEHMTPEEMILGALGSCMAQTAKLYAIRKGWDLQGVEVELEVERFSAKDYAEYEGDERFVHEIREHIVFHGNLDDTQMARLLEITTKCPVRRIIGTPTFFKARSTETLPE